MRERVSVWPRWAISQHMDVRERDAAAALLIVGDERVPIGPDGLTSGAMPTLLRRRA